MIKKIPISDFSNGFDIVLFPCQLRQSSFGDKIGSVSRTKTHVMIELSDTDLSNDIELSSIVSNHIPYTATEIEKRGKNILTANDFLTERNALKSIASAKGFANMTNEEKKICAEYCLVDDETIISYYMSLGDDLHTAQTKHCVRRAQDIDNASKQCKIRSNSAVVKYICLKYMDESNALLFMDSIQTLLSDYASLAHFGLEYGHSREGLMDYIESTNAYSGGGLSSYTFRSGMTYKNCRTELKKYLVNGEEPPEFKIFSI